MQFAGIKSPDFYAGDWKWKRRALPPAFVILNFSGAQFGTLLVLLPVSDSVFFLCFLSFTPKWMLVAVNFPSAAFL